VNPRGTTAGVAAVAALLVGTTAGAAAAIAPSWWPAEADHVTDGVAAASSNPAAVLLLAGAVRASRERDYSGTEYLSAWGTSGAVSCVVTVDHRVGRGAIVRVEPSVATGGAALEEPDAVNPPAPVDPLAVSAVEGGPLDLLRQNYVLELGLTDHLTEQVVARRHDGTLAATFWLDRASGLLVRREVFDTQGRLVRASAFVELRLDPPATPSSAPTVDLAATPETPVDRAGLVAMRQAGWVLPAQLPDGMVLYDVREQGQANERIVHLSYSDGLSTVSVFVERGRLATHSVHTWDRQQMGGVVYVRDVALGTRVTWNGKGHVYTVVADAPPSAVAAVVAALPHGERHRGLWSRFRHGLARVGSWFNPFS
jgi:sigma-E factor negative regulatory protein RseB